MAAREHSERPVAEGGRAVIADLQQWVQAWMDGDRLFPADGLSLLAALDRALAGLAGEDSEERAPGAGTRAGIAAFVGQVQALVEARVLAAEDGLPPIEAAEAMLA